MTWLHWSVETQTQSQGQSQPAEDEQYPSIRGDVSDTLVAGQRMVVAATRKQHHACSQKAASLNTNKNMISSVKKCQPEHSRLHDVFKC